jgi:hypothetical protein
VAVDRYRELLMGVLGKSTYEYVIDYLSRKGLYPPKPFVRNADDWFRYSWLFIANNEPVVHWVGKRVRELIDLGVPPDKITLAGKWVFDVKVKKGSRWVTVAYKDPVLTGGLPYWVGFQQVTNTSGVVWGCPANPPGSWSTGNLCTVCCINNNVFGIYFTGGGKPPSGYQAGVGVNCCFSAVGYNMSSPGFSFNNAVDTTGTKNVSTWTISGASTVNVTGPYLVLIISNQGTGCNIYGITAQCCPDNVCYCYDCGPLGACGCDGYYANVVFEVIYENLGSLNISSGTSISASIQLIITIASPG